MKNRLLFIILLSVFVLPSFSQVKAGENNAISLPILSFRDSVYEFGTIKSGSEAVHYFVFTNEGKSPLVISNVRTSCGCAVSEWTKAPIAAGARDSLRVEYNIKIKGAFDKTIMVYSNAVNGTVELRIRGNVAKGK